jgi:MioC protein
MHGRFLQQASCALPTQRLDGSWRKHTCAGFAICLPSQLYGTLAMKLKILVGSMTRTADHVAQAIQMECADLADAIEVRCMNNLDIEAFDARQAADTLFLVCISTYGAGDVPDNAHKLYQSLETQARFLGHVRYGVIALGDSMAHAQTFGFGGKRFDERLQDLGARRLGDICFLDASDGTLPEARGAEWCRAWLKADLAQAGMPRPVNCLS